MNRRVNFDLFCFVTDCLFLLQQVMTPLEKVFMVEIDQRLDSELLQQVIKYKELIINND